MTLSRNRRTMYAKTFGQIVGRTGKKPVCKKCQSIIYVGMEFIGRVVGGRTVRHCIPCAEQVGLT